MEDSQVRLKNADRTSILSQIKTYAGEYTPEWDISVENPDAGTALAMIFAEQMMGNIENYNEALQKYHELFTDMLGISPRPPVPSVSALIVKLVENTVPGIFLSAGTKFMAEDEKNREIIFESCQPVYITESRIDTIYMVSRRGEYRFVLGEYKIPAAGNRKYRELKTGSLKEFPLFDFGNDSFCARELYICHNYIFKGKQGMVYIKFDGGDELLKGLEDKSFGLYYGTYDNLKKAEGWQRKGEDIIFKIPGNEEDSTVMMVKAEGYEGPPLLIKGIGLSACGEGIKPQFVCNDTEDLFVEELKPFGESLSVYSQCFIGCGDVFSKKGAKITLEFDLSYGLYSTAGREKKEDLRIIKRREYAVYEEYTGDAFADEVFYEYYTGKGWRRFDIPSEYQHIFDGEVTGHVKLSFTCPDDWEEAVWGAYEGRCIRIRVIKAENCYVQPCIHHYPIIRNMLFSYSYENHYLAPESIETINGMVKRDLTAEHENRQLLYVFEGNNTEVSDRLYLGFDKKIMGGPVGIWIQKGNERAEKDRALSFRYYSKDGWDTLKVIDHTDNLSHSGTLLFIPPQDMAKFDLYGKERYCICIENQGGDMKQDTVSDIQFNSVEVMNVETGEEEDFYIDVSKPDMEFYIDCQNLISVDLWVNETGKHTPNQMLQMSEDYPLDVRVEFGYRGEINAFFVKWKEVKRFDNGPDKRVYMLRRNENKIIFGDGMNCMIPEVTDDTAFKAVTYRCNGEAGNVAAAAIKDTRSNIMYVDSIYNPQAAFGGSPTESVKMWLKRGGGLLSSHGRLITENDYIREIKGFSDCIDKAGCVISNDGIRIVLLMKDFDKGRGSFFKIRNALKHHLLRKCDMGINPLKIHITEPLFVEIHTSIWLRTEKAGDAFELTGRIKEELTAYLNPVTGHDGKGWELGVFPGYSQLVMKINTLKMDAVIQRVLVTAVYTDSRGVHECDLEKISKNPAAVVISGVHQVYT